MKPLLYLITITVILYLLTSYDGPGDADARGPARTVTTWPWETPNH
jgi:hypothetical protein